MMTPSTRPNPPSVRLAELDALRGLAAFAVLWFHYTIIVTRFIPTMGLPPLHFRYGHSGVQLFFMVSGFVIYMTLNRCRIGGDFVVSRLSRLFPAFWACLTITFLVGYFSPLPGQHYQLAQHFVNLTMLQEYVFVANVDPVYWSLSYELGFYAAMLAIFARGWLGHSDALCAWLIAGAVFFHFFPQLIPHPLHYLMVINKFGHLFAAGILLYLITNDRASALRIGLLCSTPVVEWIGQGPIAGAIVACFVLIFWLAATHRLAILRWRPLILLGAISYTLYLIHHMVGFKMIEVLHRQGVGVTLSLLLAMVGSIMLATLVTVLIERPAQRLIRNRWRPRQPAASGVA
jgi:peptidoglycan/LPS O-acetylase OafA/YrhL